MLDELTIARSRKHILRYYKSSIAALGGFPERKKPVTIYPDIDTQGQFLSYDKLNDEINGYKLSLFAPSRYLKAEFKSLTMYETHSGDPFSQADREKFLVGMMKMNFLKRLESSVKSFEITMGRTIGKIEALEKKIRNFIATPDQNPESEELELDMGDAGQDEELEQALPRMKTSLCKIPIGNAPEPTAGSRDFRESMAAMSASTSVTVNVCGSSL